MKLRAERAGGELLARMEKHKGGRPNGKTTATMARVSLSDIGIDEHQSRRWQAIAHLGREPFEGYLTATNDRSPDGGAA